MLSTAVTMTNLTAYEFPPLPSYTLSLKPSMINGIPDIYLQLIAPIIAYWGVSFIFHILDTYDLCAQYRLHTPAEVLKRNHVTRYEVVRDVILQQIIQTFVGLGFDMIDPPEMIGKEQYDIAVWARRVRRAQTQLPHLLAVIGLDTQRLALKVQDQFPAFASFLVGGKYSTTSYESWEMGLAKAIYLVGVPVVQFTIAIVIVDTWQYFLHRAMHMNKFLYTTLHSRHHRLYVPYAFGALYNHPMEGFLLDTLGTGLAYTVTGMTVKQGMWFFTCSTIKTVDDHCGYAFPWDPLQHFTSNNAAYHDVHHQSWGIKTNFSQPFFTFWDRLLGTAWTGGDLSARYERQRLAAQKKLDAENTNVKGSFLGTVDVDLDKAKAQVADSRAFHSEAADDSPAQILREEYREEQEAQQAVRQHPRRKQSGFDPKSLSDKVSGSLYGRSTPILHANGAH